MPETGQSKDTNDKRNPEPELSATEQARLARERLEGEVGLYAEDTKCCAIGRGRR